MSLEISAMLSRPQIREIYIFKLLNRLSCSRIFKMRSTKSLPLMPQIIKLRNFDENRQMEVNDNIVGSHISGRIIKMVDGNK